MHLFAYRKWSLTIDKFLFLKRDLIYAKWVSLRLLFLCSYFLWSLIVAREDSQLSLIHVPLWSLRDVHIIKDTLVSHYHKTVILCVKGNCLQFLVDLDLGCTPLGIEIFVDEFHELKPILYQQRNVYITQIFYFHHQGCFIYYRRRNLPTCSQRTSQWTSLFRKDGHLTYQTCKLSYLGSDGR